MQINQKSLLLLLCCFSCTSSKINLAVPDWYLNPPSNPNYYFFAGDGKEEKEAILYALSELFYSYQTQSRIEDSSLIKVSGISEDKLFPQSNEPIISSIYSNYHLGNFIFEGSRDYFQGVSGTNEVTDERSKYVVTLEYNDGSNIISMRGFRKHNKIGSEVKSDSFFEIRFPKANNYFEYSKLLEESGSLLYPELKKHDIILENYTQLEDVFFILLKADRKIFDKIEKKKTY